MNVVKGSNNDMSTSVDHLKLLYAVRRYGKFAIFTIINIPQVSFDFYNSSDPVALIGEFTLTKL